MPEIKINITTPPKDEKNSRFSYILLARTFFHIFVCAELCFVTVYGLTIVYYINEEQMKNPFVRDAKRFVALYGTNWTLTIQSIFFSLSLFYNLLEWYDKDGTSFAKMVRYWRDVIFSSAVVPFTLFVTSMFWTVFFIDRELVLPKIMDEILPPWFNHFLHTYTTVFVIIETILQPRRKPVDKKIELIMLSAISITYFVIYYCIKIFAGRWLYGVFGVMNWWQLILFQTAIFVLMFTYYTMQFPINRMIHRKKNGPDSAEDRNVESGVAQNGRSSHSFETTDISNLQVHKASRREGK